MKRKQFASPRARQAIRAACACPERSRGISKRAKRQIDFSDIPESTDKELQRARRVGRPRTGRAKQLIAIRIAPRLLAQLRRLAAKQDKPYQTLIHELLEKAAKRKVA